MRHRRRRIVVIVRSIALLLTALVIISNPLNDIFSSHRCASTGWLSVSGTTWTGQKSATTFPPVWWWVRTTRCTCACPYSNICSQKSFSSLSPRSCRFSSRWDAASHFIHTTSRQTIIIIILAVCPINQQSMWLIKCQKIEGTTCPL